MTTTPNKPKNHVRALVIAFGTTVVLGALMLALGINAFTSKSAQAATIEPVDVESAMVDELEALVAEYQDREVQYQSELTQAADQINQANAQINQANAQIVEYESLIQNLQDAGVIQVDASGQVTAVTNAFPQARPSHDH